MDGAATGPCAARSVSWPATGELVDELLDSPAVVGFCWSQLADTQQERHGLVTAQRRPKVPVEDIRAVSTRVSAAIPGDAVGESPYGDHAPGSAGGRSIGLAHPCRRRRAGLLLENSGQ